jgi:lipoprotein-anchoring transpeptidase ErfK/SrfK
VRFSAKTLALSCVLLAAAQTSCVAQGLPSWADELFGTRRWGYERSPRWHETPRLGPSEVPRKPRQQIDLSDGGPRPAIAAVEPPTVAFAHDFPVNSIVIDSAGRKLYYVLPDRRAYEYSISVGREGFNWTGSETVSRKQPWPDWYPPAEMRERDPKLPEKMTGGIKNPLGAIALYLGKTLYRIHGTNDPKSIGHASSSGCFRMLNSSVLHLASIAEIGTPVSVVASLNGQPNISRTPEAAREREVPLRPELAGRPDQEARAFRDYRSLRDATLQSR